MYALTILSLASTAACWGALGHDTIAYVAQNYVADDTATWAQQILGDSSSSYLANVATWADSYRYTAAGRFSAPFHFIDAEDNPPSSCNVDFDRDCGASGCSISAIANYTTRVQSATLPADEVTAALKFLVHFIGDISKSTVIPSMAILRHQCTTMPRILTRSEAQPLHDEAYEYGGNDVDVKFNGTKTNLHHIWDTNMPELLRGGYGLSYAASWAQNLTTEIDSGIYQQDAASWIASIDVTDPKATALSWAVDANAYVCSVVMPDGPAALESAADLYPKYYDSAVATFELQIAKAGYRLAKWLDALAENASDEKKRWTPERSVAVDLSGRSLLPPPRPLSPAKLRRELVGFGCNHEH
nr:nuclease s1 [Quercus suber]